MKVLYGFVFVMFLSWRQVRNSHIKLNDYTGLFIEWCLDLYVLLQAVSVHRSVMDS